MTRFFKPRLRCASLLGVLFLSLALGGCDDTSGLSAEAFVERAKAHRADGELRASVIELKNALQKDPQSMEVRLLLGRTYVEIGDALGAEKEILRARDLGADPATVRELLGQAWLLQGKYEQVLREIVVDEGVPAAERATVLVLRGRARLGIGQLDQAKLDFERALNEDPSLAPASVGLARVAMQRRDFTRADEALAQALEAAPDEPDALIVKGQLEFLRGNYADSESLYQKAMDSRRDNPLFHLGLARVQIASGKTDEAVAHLQGVLDVIPKHPGANHLRALAAYQAKDYETAKVHSETVLSVDPGHLPSLLIAGATSYAEGQLEQANNYLKGFLAEVPSHVGARRLLGSVLLKLGKAGDAVATLEPAVGESSEDAELLAMIGSAAVQSGDLRAGSEYLERALKARPESAAGFAKLGAVRVELGEVEQGIADLERSIELDPQLNRAIVILFAAYLKVREFDKALAAAERLQKNQPENPAGYTMAGIAHLTKGEMDAGRAAFLKALEVKPGALDANTNLAVLELKSGNPDQARTHLTEALMHHPGHLDILLRLANLEQRLERRTEAMGWLEKAVEANPEAVRPRLMLGRLHLIDGRPEGALAVTEGLLANERTNPALLEVVGKAQLAARRPSDAAATFRSLVEAQPDTAASHYLLAVAYRSLQEWARQRQELETALSIDPSHVQSRIDLVRALLRENNVDQAVNDLAWLKRTVPDNTEILELDGAVALMQDRVADAVTLLEKAAERRSTSDLTLRLALARWRSGDQEGSVQTLESWLERYPDDQRARFLLASHYLSLGRVEAARTNYEAIVQASPDNAVARNNLAWVLMDTGDPEAALPHAERALELASDDPKVMDTAGLILLQLGETERAVSLLRGAAAGQPTNLKLRYHLAQALAKQGNAPQARDILQQILSDPTDFKEREEAESLLQELQD